jgi:hypothetical protein
MLFFVLLTLSCVLLLVGATVRDWQCFRWFECRVSVDVYSAAVCWCGVSCLCVLLFSFCVVIVNGVKYGILEIE